MAEEPQFYWTSAESHTQAFATGEQQMPEFVVLKLNDFDISKNGRTTRLNFLDVRRKKVSLSMTVLELERITHELGFLLTQARQLSEESKQDIVPFMRPIAARASALKDGTAVVISFQIPSGLEMHYGLDPTRASALATQLEHEAQRSMKSDPPSRH
jgi:hypothetical protein